MEWPTINLESLGVQALKQVNNDLDIERKIK